VNDKYCPMCKQNLPRTEFHKNSRTNDGLHGFCKKCRSNKYYKNGPVKKITPYSKEELLSRPIEHMLEIFTNKQLAKIWGVCENEASDIRCSPWITRDDWKHDLFAGEPKLNRLKRVQLMEFIEKM